MTLRLLDTFAGIGGFSLAAHQLGGFETIGFVEREPFCQRILSQHFPNIPIYDDITTFNPEQGAADVVCGGFPCQDISLAGKQAGIKEGTRSGLFYELMRVVRMVQPSYVVLENVSAILTNGLDTVLGELAEAGFDAEWACIPASAVGACHQRDRWWLIAYPASDARQFQSSERQDLRDIFAINGSSRGLATDSQSSRRRTRKGQSTQSIRQQITGVGDNSAGSAAADSDTSGSLSTAQLGIHQPKESGGARDGKPQRLCSTFPPNPNHQRQQEQHPSAVSDRQGWPRWGDAPQRLNPDWRSYSSQPVLCRGDDGLSNRVDRLKALGNAVVPQVAMIPLQRVLDLYRGQR